LSGCPYDGGQARRLDSQDSRFGWNLTIENLKKLVKRSLVVDCWLLVRRVGKLESWEVEKG
jgi:hypothetical protein